MSIRIRSIAVAAAAFAAALATALPAQTAQAAQGGRAHGHTVDVCGSAAPSASSAAASAASAKSAPSDQVRCFARLRTDVHGGRGVRGAATGTTLPAGLSPTDLHSAYKLPWTGGANQTVGIVDAGDDPTAEADLAVYRSTYGLPPCTTANGCFRKVNQTGAASPLPADVGWGVEIALDLDMVSAACPSCKILLVEGDDASYDDLGTAVDTAVSLGATEVSNSYGGDESSLTPSYEHYYTHPGVAILASSGDAGYGVPSAPAVYPAVIAVGGTSLAKASNARGWSETAWWGAGAGCSAWVDKPAWQTDPNCPGRMVSDVAADADPDTGPAVYGTTDGLTGWGQVGGTSAASPFIAGVVALAGHPQLFANASRLYSHTSGLFDVVGGNDSLMMDCGGDYQCNGVAGYDGPTGLGTPNGLSAF